MRDKLKKSCERLTPSDETKINMFNHISENLRTKDISSKKINFAKYIAWAGICLGIGIVCILGASFLIKTNTSPMNTPIYALSISNHNVSLRKANEVIETSRLMHIDDQEGFKTSTSDNGYTFTLTNASVNGELVNLFFEISQNNNQKIQIQRSDNFSGLDMKINCILASENHPEKIPIMEWFMLEDSDLNDNKIQFGISLWNDMQADTVNISITDLCIGNSKNIFKTNQTISGNWDFTVPLKTESETIPKKEQTYILNQEIVYRDLPITCVSATYSKGTLSIKLAVPNGNLNKKPFIDEIIKIETDKAQLYPSYGSGSHDGTTRTLLYVLEGDTQPGDIKNLVIGNLKYSLLLE